MPDEINTITTGRKTIGEFTIEYQRSGYGGCIPVIDGTPQPALTFGYATESDRAACMKLIEDALRASGNDISAIQRYIMTAVNTAAHNIHPDEAVRISGTEVLLSYTDRKAYCDGTEIASLDDLTCDLPDEAIKALLISRVQRYIDLLMQDDEWDDYDEEEFDYE